MSHALSAEQPPCVLLAEDNPVNAMVMSRQLAALGYACSVAEDGEAAWTLLQSGEYVALLTDCEMPVLDGYALTARLRATPAHADLPVIALSARPDDAQRARCRAAGMDVCLSKPVSNEALADALACPRNISPDERRGDTIDEDLHALRALYTAPSALATVLSLFVRSSRVDMLQLDQCYLRRAPKPFQQAAHRLVGSLQLLGQQDLARVLSAWNRAAALPSASEYAAVHARLAAFVERVQAELTCIDSPP